jgi:precorrin-3B synthase
MTAPMIKGWCPGALRPMASGDGLVLRLRLTAGRLTSETAEAIAALAQRHGNGRIDLSQRGNLQLRGVSEATLPALHAELAALDLIDADPATEARRNLVVSPLGSEAMVALAERIEAALAAATHLAGLPAKFAFLLDDGSWPRPAGLGFDVAFVAAGEGWSVVLPGACVATVATADVPATAVRLAEAFLARRGAARRMAELTDTPEAARTILEAAGLAANVRPYEMPAVSEVIGLHGTTLGVGIPFGQMDAAQLSTLATTARRSAAGDLRLTPFRAILLPDVRAPEVATATLAAAGFITDPADPCRAVVACTGAPACSSGLQPARVTAADLAPIAARLPGEGVRLHVSGCAKGCARPGITALTLVGTEAGYDLVLDGTTRDRPRNFGLDPAALAGLLAERIGP